MPEEVSRVGFVELREPPAVGTIGDISGIRFGLASIATWWIPRQTDMKRMIQT